MWYWDGVEERWYLLQINGCGNATYPCPLEEYKKIIHDILPREEDFIMPETPLAHVVHTPKNPVHNLNIQKVDRNEKRKLHIMPEASVLS